MTLRGKGFHLRFATPATCYRIEKLIDLLMGLFRGAVFHHGGVPENCLSVNGAFPLLNGAFSLVNGPSPERLNGPFSLLKIHWKTAH